MLLLYLYELSQPRGVCSYTLPQGRTLCSIFHLCACPFTLNRITGITSSMRHFCEQVRIPKTQNWAAADEKASPFLLCRSAANGFFNRGIRTSLYFHLIFKGVFTLWRILGWMRCLVLERWPSAVSWLALFLMRKTLSALCRLLHK